VDQRASQAPATTGAIRQARAISAKIEEYLWKKRREVGVSEWPTGARNVAKFDLKTAFSPVSVIASPIRANSCFLSSFLFSPDVSVTILDDSSDLAKCFQVFHLKDGGRRQLHRSHRQISDFCRANCAALPRGPMCIPRSPP
jgi:hypothetical protein